MAEPASRQPGAQPPPRAAAAFLCSCDELRRTEQRVLRIADAATRRADALLSALQQLPAAATYEPFPTAEPAAAEAASPTQATGQRKRPPSAASLQKAASPHQRPLQTPVGRGVPQSAVGGLDTPAPSQAAAASSPARQFVAQVGSAAALGGRLLAELMQRPLSPLQSPVAPVAARFDAGQGPAPAGPLARLAAQLAGDPPSARQAARPGAREAAQRSARQPPRSPAGAAQSALGELGGLIQTAAGGLASSPLGPGFASPLLAELLNGAAPQTGRATRATGAATQHAAPRANSRLLQDEADRSPAAGPQPPRRTPPPQSDPLPDDAAPDALLQGLNRLLLDQAWMRGVDLG